MMVTTARRKMVSFMRPVRRVAIQKAMATPGAEAAMRMRRSAVKSPWVAYPMAAAMYMMVKK